MMKKIILLLLGVVGIGGMVNAQCTPVFTPNSNIAVDVDPGACTANVAFTYPTFTGCASGVLVQTMGLPSGSNFPVGITTNAFELYDSLALFTEDFSDNSAGWTIGTEWFIAPTVASTGCGGVGYDDPAMDNSPTADNGVAGVVLGGCYGTTIHGYYYLTSPVINLSATTSGNVMLDFYRWLNSDYPNYVTNVIEVFNGVSWVQIWSGPAGTFIDDMEWNNFTYDISGAALGNANFQVRFGFNVGSSGVISMTGWNLDDITIYSMVPTGNTTSFNVLVSPTAPEFSACPTNSTNANVNGLVCSEVVNYSTPVAGASCGAVTTSMTAGLASGDEFPVGTTTVTYTSVLTNPDFAVLFNEDFADNSAGWTLDTEWEIGATLTSGACDGLGGSDPANDHTTTTADNGVAGVMLGGCYSTGLHGFYYLTSPVIDLSNAGGTVNLDFYRWLNSDYPNYVTNVIDVYDGNAWVNLWTGPGGTFIQDAEWYNFNYDISAYTSANFQVRFGFDVGSGGVVAMAGWNIDDVMIYSDAAVLSSTCTFDVTVDPAVTAAMDSVCAGQDYVFGTQTLTAAGVYTETFVGAGVGGCDSTVSLTLSLIDTIGIALVTTSDEILGNDGAIDISITSVNPYTISWNTGSTTEDLTGLAAGVYTVTVTDDVTGCSSMFDVTVNSQVGIEENVLNSLQIFPNPNQGQFVVASSDPKIVSVEIHDNMGRIVASYANINAAEFNVDMRNLTAGMYQVNVATEIGTSIKTIILQ